MDVILVTTAENPFFINPANRDYHLDAAVSPAVDYCTNAQAVPVFKDIDIEDRGFDDVFIPNNNATKWYLRCRCR